MKRKRLMQFCLFTVFVLGSPLARANGRDCVSDLTVLPPPVGAYDVRVHSGPVLRQCAGTCRYESALSHLQNIHSIAFSADYLAIKRMMKTLIYYVQDAERGHTDRMVSDGQWINTLEPPDQAEVKNSFWSTIFKIKLENGLLPAAAFGFPPAFADQMHAWAKSVGLVRSSGAQPFSVLEILNVRVGVELQEMKARIEAGLDPKIEAARARREADQLFALALTGVRRGFDAAAFSEMLLPDGKTIEAKAEDVDAFVIDHLQRGRNVVLYVVWRKDRYDESSSSLRLKDRFEQERAQSDDSMQAGRGHAVTIDGYQLGPDGRLAWLLVKDSQGSQHADQGYVHMHADYFRAYVRSVNALVDSGTFPQSLRVRIKLTALRRWIGRHWSSGLRSTVSK